jgi:hypothetical protein
MAQACISPFSDFMFHARSTEGPMTHAHFKSVLAAVAAISAVIAVHGTPTPICLAGEAESCCSDCSDCGSNCGICRWCDCCCTCCDRVCQFRLIDGCTKCAWSRTWHGPNALATPLREYYIPRPPQCCCYNGCEPCMANPGGAGWEMPADTNYPSRMTLTSEVSPEAAAGFSPAQFERLGKVRNELDVLGAAGTPARAPAPAR